MAFPPTRRLVHPSTAVVLRWLALGCAALAVAIGIISSNRAARLGKGAAAAETATADAASTAVDGNWARFRGPNGSGIARGQGLPVRWGEDDYLWKVTLPGEGHSCPCVWEDRVFVTSAEDEGRRRFLLCLDTATGDVLWQKEFSMATHGKHRKSSYASNTPAADGERVYVVFGSREQTLIAALDFSGQIVWDRQFAPFLGKHGSGTSPVVFEDLLFLAHDHAGDSSVLALDKRDGSIRWQVPRKTGRSSYATPVIVQRPGVPTEVVFTSQAEGVAAFNARTGEKHWAIKPFKPRTVSSPVFGGGMVFQTSGGGGVGKYMVALRPGGKSGSPGDVRTAWTRKRQLPYVPTPVVYGEHLYLWGDNGVVSCVEAATGENIWTERVQGNFTGSPICVDGKLYCLSEDGDVVVIRAGTEFELLGRNSLGDPSHSTPAAAHGRLFLRTFHHLSCVGSSNE